MPAKKRQTDEERKKAFEDYLKGEENSLIEEFIKVKKDLVPLETSLEDVCDPRKQYLDLLFKMVATMKVPGRKAKSYEQKYFRTIFFTKNQEKTIDGTTFVLTNDTKVHIWNSKQAIANIEILLDPEMMDTSRTQDTLNSWRKDLIKLLKEFDKLYVQHIKPSTKSKQYSHDEMAGYHKIAMTPLVELMDSNWNLKKLEMMMAKDKSLPVFRFNALEERFVVDFTKFNDVIKQYGDLKDPYDIRQMLETLKIKDWREIPPLEYYLTPMQQKLDDVRKELIDMRNMGPDLCKYILEDNKILMGKIIEMVAHDNTVQWLAGNELKQDQFKFIYKVGDIIFKSALKDNLISKEKDQSERVLSDVWPKLVAFKTLLEMRNIKIAKEADQAKAKDKAERARLNGEDEEKQETKSGQIANAAQQILDKRAGVKKKNEPEVDEAANEARRLAALEEQERQTYGRYDIWQSYYNPQNAELWERCSERLRHVNDQVLEDIEDFILLEGWPKSVSAAKINQLIQKDLENRRNRSKELSNDKESDPIEEGKKEDAMRRLMNKYRPPHYWNFFEEEIEVVPHVFRPEADPNKCYIDGRVAVILQDIEALGMNLSHYEEVKWKKLRDHTREIFIREEEEELKKIKQPGGQNSA